MKFLSSFLFATLFGMSILAPQLITAQVLESDSLALVDLYNEMEGPNWDNNTNWLSGPVPAWFGVTINNNRVVALNLDGNNLQGATPASINDLTALQTLNLAENAITSLNDLSSMPGLSSLLLNDNLLEALPLTASTILLELNCADNQLHFDDLEPFLTFSIPNFTYAPQRPVGDGGFRYLTPGSSDALDVSVGGTANQYQWLKDGSFIGPTSANSAFSIVNAMESDEGVYFCQVTNTNFPALVIESVPVTVLLNHFDLLGGEYIPNHLIVEFVDEATDEERDSLLDFYQATRLDSCLCGVLELWVLPDTSFLPKGEILIGVEGVKEDAMTKSEIEETGFNYVLALLEKDKSTTTYTARQTQAVPPPPPTDHLAVAVIDVGVDLTHSALLPYVWSNPDELPNGLDDDGNCLVDDRRGYNFIDKGGLPLDTVNGHGTHVAGIITDGLPIVSDVRVMALKSHEDDGFGTLFNALCGIYYANDQDAKVINLSWGYTGLPSPLLESAIFRAGLDCGALVVTSAGNDAEDNDLMPHYPSSFELDNLVSVAALNIMKDSLADFSNFGLTSVDLAAPGERILSTLPGDETGFKSGTSMAAAAVSNAAIQLYELNPEATYLNVRAAILDNTEELTSLDGLVETGGKLDLDAAKLAIMEAVPDTSCSIFVKLDTEPISPFSEVQLYPQPFRDWLVIQFALEQGTEVNATMYNLSGQVCYQQRNYFGTGTHRFEWDGRSNSGSELPPGLYILRLQAEGYGVSTKVIKQ